MLRVVKTALCMTKKDWKTSCTEMNEILHTKSFKALRLGLIPTCQLQWWPRLPRSVLEKTLVQTLPSSELVWSMIHRRKCVRSSMLNSAQLQNNHIKGLWHCIKTKQVSRASKTWETPRRDVRAQIRCQEMSKKRHSRASSTPVV